MTTVIKYYYACTLRKGSKTRIIVASKNYDEGDQVTLKDGNLGRVYESRKKAEEFLLKEYSLVILKSIHNISIYKKEKTLKNEIN